MNRIRCWLFGHQGWQTQEVGLFGSGNWYRWRCPRCGEYRISL